MEALEVIELISKLFFCCFFFVFFRIVVFFYFFVYLVNVFKNKRFFLAFLFFCVKSDRIQRFRWRLSAVLFFFCGCLFSSRGLHMCSFFWFDCGCPQFFFLWFDCGCPQDFFPFGSIAVVRKIFFSLWFDCGCSQDFFLDGF